MRGEKMRKVNPVVEPRSDGRRLTLQAAVALGAGLTVTNPGAAQVIGGRILDSADNSPVVTAGVFLMDREGNQLANYVAEEDGRYRFTLPGPGEYVLFAQRLGYFDTDFIRFSVATDSTYGLDLEMRPEPIPLDPIEAVVTNEAMVDWLRLELGVNPNTIFGFRAYQGQRLAEVQARSRDNTDMLRKLYIPVSHGRLGVCFGYGGSSVQRGSPSMTGWAEAQMLSPAPCGTLMVNDREVPAVHLDTAVDLDSVAVVVWLPGQVRLYTRGFKWEFR